MSTMTSLHVHVSETNESDHVQTSSGREDVPERGGRPSPMNFVEFIPWACLQMMTDFEVFITKTTQNEYSGYVELKSKKSKADRLKSRSHVPSSSDIQFQGTPPTGNFGMSMDPAQVRITAVYSSDHLVEIKFDRNPRIPRVLLKVIAMITKFHYHLNTISICSGVDAYTLHEICHMLPMSHITNICLDNSRFPEANFHILLENYNLITNLSLARCTINDIVVKELANNLIYPNNGSKFLRTLNLSSNRITDVGARHLAEALRYNTELAYLNLANNMINDDGATAILNVLQEFPLTYDEIIEFKKHKIDYLRQREQLIREVCMELKSEENDKKIQKKRKSIFIPSKKEVEIEQNETLSADYTKDSSVYQRAEIIVNSTIGGLTGPFNDENTVAKNCILYCRGNNALCYLNLAYNNLSYIFLEKLLSVLRYQGKCNRKPKGLVNVLVEGNNLPMCRELNEINDLLLIGLKVQWRKGSSVSRKKVGHSKSFI